MDEDERRAQEEFIRWMLTYTVSLVRAEPGKLPVGAAGMGGVASGFMVLVEGTVRVISAAHAIASSRDWAVELLPVQGTKTLMLSCSDVEPVAKFNPKLGPDQFDLAWAEINLERVQKQLTEDPDFAGLSPELPLYTGPLAVEPDNETPYGFAAWNHTEFHPALSTLLRENSAELYMRYIDTEPKSGLYRFELAREHQGHDYYRGASGAPIFGIDGRIVSMLVGGLEEADGGYVYGVPLKNYASRLLSPK